MMTKTWKYFSMQGTTEVDAIAGDPTNKQALILQRNMNADRHYTDIMRVP